MMTLFFSTHFTQKVTGSNPVPASKNLKTETNGGEVHMAERLVIRLRRKVKTKSHTKDSLCEGYFKQGVTLRGYANW